MERDDPVSTKISPDHITSVSPVCLHPAPAIIITQRSLWKNDMGDANGMALAEALKTNTTVKVIRCVSQYQPFAT